MTAENKVFEEAAQTMFELVSDENVQELCRRREDYYKQIRTYEKELADKDAQIAKITTEKDAEIAALKAQLAQTMNKNSEAAETVSLIKFNL